VLQPEKTLFILITDLYEGGREAALLKSLAQLAEDRVHLLCLLALDDSGRPSYNRELARRVRAVGVPTFGCTPNRLVELVEDILRGKEITA
jgi:uncharacterized protein (DUF58 family)